MSSLSVPRSFALLGALTIACASPGGRSGTAESAATAPTSRAVISDAEIPKSGSESAYDMIQRLRPEYLRAKPTQSFGGATSTIAPPPSLFMNGQRMGELTDLRQIPALSLSMVRYYSIEEGKRKFGMQYGGGVIEIAYRGP